jgi:hypothetical protein
MAALGPYVPFEHWPDATRTSMAVAYADKAVAAAARIRESMLRMPCKCTRPGELAEDGRCSHCWGWTRSSA